MKKFLALSLVLSTLTGHASTSATLLLKGTIQPKLSISVTPETIAAALDLTTSTPQSGIKVATVNEKSNSNSGYKVTISSQNKGNLKNGEVLFPYTLSYNGSAIDLSGTVTQTNSAVTAANVNKNVVISYTGKAQEELVAGDYVDNVTFTIAQN